MDVAAVRPTAAHRSGPEGRGWFKSSYSQGNGECVECARLGNGRVGVRDSKRPQGAVLVFGSREWRAFVTAIREGAFTG